MNAVQEYLRLSSAYCNLLGGIRWSSRDDTMVYVDGSTFAFNEEIAAFLAGFGRQRPLIHFGHVLHLLDLLRNSRRLPAPEVVRLHRAFTEAAGTFANAGVFFAHVCRSLPSVPLTVDAQEVRDRLRNPAMPIRWFLVSFHDTFHPAEAAPLEPEAFEQVVLRGIAPYRDDELRHWFRHGRGAVKDAGAEVARQLPVPRTLTGVLAALLERPRLAGAQAFVAQLVGALTLPPRRLAHQELPIGGYADVTTHGPVDQILPSQFALDEWDFFRRYAERELLYFRREEPPARTRQELVVLLDQGVRTWGDVRLVLSAAALAFGKQAARRGTPFFLAATSQEGDLIDPVNAQGEVLGRLIEASDLSPQPGRALEKVLEQHAQGARDVVLLTHPRNLREPDVASAARRVAPDVRLFAVAMEAGGKVELSELRHGVPVPLRHFQVAYPQPAPPPPEAEMRTETPDGWSGDVERIGFPFRFGVSSPITHFDFDFAGEWLLTASQHGMLHAWRVDGSDRLILPRGVWNEKVLTSPKAVVGVAGGFAIVGHIEREVVVFHYDIASRSCTAHLLDGPLPGGGSTPYKLDGWSCTHSVDGAMTNSIWTYSREYHTLFTADVRNLWGVRALDINTGEISTPTTANMRPRIRAFWQDWKAWRLPLRRMWCPNEPPQESKALPFCYLNHSTGEVHVHGMTPAWHRFTPLADGRPVLKGWFGVEAQRCRNILALTTSLPGTKGTWALELCRGPAGTPIAQYPVARLRMGFLLSADGKRLARVVSDYRVEVNRVGGDNVFLLGTHFGGFSPQVQFVLGEGWLILATGKGHLHLVHWDWGPLKLLHRHDKRAPLTLDAFYQERRDKPLRLTGVEATREEVPALAGYDHGRFILGATTDVTAVADRFGQIAVFDGDGKLVCMFFAFRQHIGAWMPDGTRHGPPSVITGPPTPDALTRIGEALRAACAGEETVMKVAFRLRRLAEAAPATALLVPSHQPEDVLHVCALLGADPLPEIYAVAEGFLLRLPAPAAKGREAPGTQYPLFSTLGLGILRLRNLAGNLLLPVDAELVPALLDDEAAALGRQRGLAFLPGGRVLEFTPQAPLPLAALLGVTGLGRPPWQALPERPALAERLTEIALDQPDEAPDAVLEAGGEGIGTDDPRPADTGAPARALGKAAFGIGKGMAWLGSALHLRGLARAGAKVMAAALNLAPRLSEALLGQQEANLRDLLRDFRAGHIERALRRALPLGGDTARGATPAQNARLPTNNIIYSLRNILGGDGPPGLWFGNFDAYHELEREYRKQAELATRAGDYRRAAFIYGKLLRDYRAAAAALAQGGLHHDAAILYLSRLNDSLAAAREFEAAGEIDRALQLYRQRGEHALAGDLLRRAGEEELAIVEYRQAAARLVVNGHGHYQAGELLLTRARRSDLALEYYQGGWENRPCCSPVPCAIRLAQLYTQDETPAKLLTLTTQAEAFLAPPGNDTPAAEFFNEIARLADRPALARVRDDLRDRALVAIAAKMRQRVTGRPLGDLAGTMLAPSAGWAATVVSDAAYALRGRPPAPSTSAPFSLARILIRARHAVVTAVCQAPDTGDLFVGFESGEVFRVRPTQGAVVALTDERVPIWSLAADVTGEELFVLAQKTPDDTALVSRFTASVGQRMAGSQVVKMAGDGWLCALVTQERVGLWNGTEFQILSMTSLLTTNRRTVPEGSATPVAALALPAAEPTAADPALLVFEGGDLVCYDGGQLPRHTWTVGWTPTLADEARLFHPTVSWLRKGAAAIELAGLGPHGSVYWSDVEFRERLMVRVETRAMPGTEAFQAVAIVRPGLLAAATRNSIQWLRRSGAGFRVVATVPHDLPPVVACFPHYRGNELLVLCREGTVARLPDMRY